MTAATPATYGLLGMLATRPMTGYELTQQVKRSLRFVWSTSEGHLYREQKKLVTLGWATVASEAVGQRTRQRYAITRKGRTALRSWLASSPEEPHLQVEGILRAFYADSAGPEELAASLRATAASARAMLTELGGFAREYLEEGGPLSMLEDPEAPRSFRGRQMFPERLHAVAVAVDLTTRLLATIDDFCGANAEEVDGWVTTTDASLIPRTRERLEAVRERTAP